MLKPALLDAPDEPDTPTPIAPDPGGDLVVPSQVKSWVAFIKKDYKRKKNSIGLWVLN